MTSSSPQKVSSSVAPYRRARGGARSGLLQATQAMVLAVAAVLAVLPFQPLRAQGLPEAVGEGGRAVLTDVSNRSDTTGGMAPDTVRVVRPRVVVVHNTALPSAGNDGPLWAGRGTNLLLDGGVAIKRSSESAAFFAQFRPALVVSRNRPFFVFPGSAPGRSAFSSPWHRGAASIDLPLRFGDRPVTELHLGESFARVEWKNADLGFSTANYWWGPGLRNALVLSDNAPGFAHVFAGTANPVGTRLGSVDAKVLLGSLTESRFFDRDDDNNARSVNGAFVEFRPARAPHLTVGLARLVIAPVPGSFDAIPHAFDFLTKWPTAPDSSGEDDAPSWSSDQLTSLFLKWAAPTIELYAEWARTDVPRSLTDLLVTPHASQGYTLGLQWTNPVGSGVRPPAVRLQAEFSNLEQTATDTARRTTDYYTGRATAHGFTHRGQLLGAAIGPGASSQFFAGDFLASGWRVGLFAGRTRTENDAMYRMPDPRMTKHDVTIYGGIRGAARSRRTDFAAELLAGRRFNYLFQSEAYNAGQPGNSIDVSNLTLSLSVTPVR